MENLKAILSLVSLSATTLLLFSGCNNNIPKMPIDGKGEHFIYHHHNFGPNRDNDYKAGVVDGCRTSDGDYTKDHTRFRTNESYHAGWEHGRLHCKGTPAS